jgi:cell shape-determining protein MreD
MKKFIWLSLIGALGSAGIALLSGAIGDHFLSAWKYEQAGWFSAVIGFVMVFVNQVLVFPVRVISFGFSSSVVLIVASIINFALWGGVFALAVKRPTRRSSGTRPEAGEPLN